MMKTAVVYYSKHHGNTKKLLDELARHFDGLTLIDAAQTAAVDLSAYDAVGFASGIYYSKLHKSVLRAAQEALPQGKKVFFLYTCGAEKKGYTDAIRKAIDGKGAEILGEFGCPGYDTFGPFKLIGGIAKGRPNEEDLVNACRFYERILG